MISKPVLALVLLLVVAGGLYFFPLSSNVGHKMTDVQQPFAKSEPVPGLVEVYDGIGVAKNTTELDLSGRGLTGSLKAEVRQLSQLEVLDLSNNNFTGLPAEVGQLSQLRVLNLSNNPFTGLPYELGNLSNLETLDLRGTQYAEADLEVIKQSFPVTTKVLTD